MIDFYNEIGVVIMFDDDSGGMGVLCIEIDFVVGIYCFVMCSFDNLLMIGFVCVGIMLYELLIEGFGMFELINFVGNGGGNGGGLFCNLVCMVVMGVLVIVLKNEIEFWGFIIDEFVGVVIIVESDSVDLFIIFYDFYGDYIIENDDWDGLNLCIELSYVFDFGDYCIVMDVFSDSFVLIIVLVEEYDEEVIMCVMYDCGEVVLFFDGSYLVVGIGVLEICLCKDLNVFEEISWVVFDVNEFGLVLVEVIVIMDGDLYIILFDELGCEIVYNDDYGQGLDFLLIVCVIFGIYLLVVGDLNGFGLKMWMLMECYVFV